MILPPEAWRTRDGLPALLDALGAADGDTRLVGGVVRDTLLGIPVADIDLATRHAPEETSRRIAAAGFKPVPTGIAHGTVTAILPSGPIEVTTLRRDIATDGRHAEVAFTDDWQADAARRDFTINALSADPASGAVHDYFGGLADLAARRVRFIGDPQGRIAEDHLRILRFFRFIARFATGAADRAGLAACAARANDLMALSRERIAQEMLRLLALPDPAPTLATMLDHAILAPVLPEINAGAAARVAALRAIERATDLAPDAVRTLAACLPADPAVADAVVVRLRLSNAQRKRIALAKRPPEPDPAAMRARLYRDGRTATVDQLLSSDLSPNTIRAGLAAIEGWEPPRLPIGGGALIALGFTPGPGVAAALQAIERRWIAEGFPPAPRVEAIAREEAALVEAPL